MISYREIPGYSRYGISESGEVFDFVKNREMQPFLRNNSRLFVSLKSDEGKWKMRAVHQFVAMTYLGHEPQGMQLVVDHIDNDRFNNHVSNLQIITQRKNSSKDQWRRNPVSRYPGVTLRKSGKWRSKIRINNKDRHLGYFINEDEAARAYELAVIHAELFRDPIQFRKLINNFL
jgi:hypothetical protein